MMMASAWDLEPSEILFVGDSQDDIGCGKAAGMKTVLFDPTSKRPHLHSVSNLVVTSLMEIMQHLTNGVLL
jgi:FMN phosphatase YigB (HAD superfamily)